jgi:TonB-dependent starch-binding outer membrane protein SusC
MSRLHRLGAVAFFIGLLPGVLRAQTTGTISGRVVAAEGQPIVGAQVSIAGTTRGANTDQQGRYTIAGVPAGVQRVRARMLGYTPGDQTVTISAGGTATVDFQLQQSALQVGAVVVTATGQEQQQREIGSSIGVIDVSQTPLAPVTSTSELIQGRVASASAATTACRSRTRR